MSRDTRTAGLSFLFSAIIVAVVSISARTFYTDSKATAAEIEAAVQSVEQVACE